MLEAHEGYVTAVCVSPDPSSQRVVSASVDGSLKIWETKTGEVIRTLSLVRPAEELAAEGGHDRERLREREMNSRAKIELGNTVVDFADTGNGDSGGGIEVMKAGGRGHKGAVLCAATGTSPFTSISTSTSTSAPISTESACSWFIASGGEDRNCLIWNPLSGAVLHTLAHETPVRSVRISENGTKVITGSGTGSCVVSLREEDLQRTIAPSSPGKKARKQVQVQVRGADADAVKDKDKDKADDIGQ